MKVRPGLRLRRTQGSDWGDALSSLPHRGWGSTAEGREGAARERGNGFDAGSALARDPSTAFRGPPPHLRWGGSREVARVLDRPQHAVQVPEHLGGREPHDPDAAPRQVGVASVVTAQLAQVVTPSVHLDGQAAFGAVKSTIHGPTGCWRRKRRPPVRRERSACHKASSGGVMAACRVRARRRVRPRGAMYGTLAEGGGRVFRAPRGPSTAFRGPPPHLRWGG